MASSIFLKIPGVDGESVHKGYEKHFHLSFYAIGAQHPHSVGTGTSGPSSGETTFSDVQFSLANQKNSNTLLLHMCTGNVYKTGVELVVLVDSGPETFIEHIKYKFTEVMLTSWNESCSDGQGIPPTSWSFGFAKIEAESKIQQSDGVVGSGATVSYDLRTKEAS